MKNYEKTIKILDKHKKQFEKARELVNTYKLETNHDYKLYEDKILKLIDKETFDSFYELKEENNLNNEQFLYSLILVIESYINEQLKIIKDIKKLSDIINDLSKDNHKKSFIIVVKDINDNEIVNHMLDIVRYIFAPQLLNFKTYIINYNNIDIYKEELFSSEFNEPVIMFFDLDQKNNPILYHQGLSLYSNENSIK